MHPAIQTRQDSKRGCGWRKPGGLYLVADGPSAPCGKLPIPLEICPTCSGGIHFSRSWTWVNGTALAAQKECQPVREAITKSGLSYTEFITSECSLCPLGQPLGRCGLLWVGEKFYQRPEDWTGEAMTKGVSRRIPAVPRDFEVGKTWVLVAHKKCIRNPDGTFTPAIFHAFRPSAVEYVVKGDETDEEIDALVRRGLTPVVIERQEQAAEVPLLPMATPVVRPCLCGSGKESEEMLDARGIYCGRVCEDCEAEKRSQFRPEIFEDSDYYADEPIDAE